MSDKFVDFSLEVTAPPGWFLSITPATLSVAQGAIATFQVKGTAQGGKTGSVTLGIVGLPTGVVAVFTPPVINVDGSSTVEIPTVNIPVGKLTLKLRGSLPD